MRLIFALIALGMVAGCASEPRIPGTAELPPVPTNAHLAVEQWLQYNLKDPGSVVDLSISRLPL